MYSMRITQYEVFFDKNLNLGDEKFSCNLFYCYFLVKSYQMYAVHAHSRPLFFFLNYY